MGNGFPFHSAPFQKYKSMIMIMIIIIIIIVSYHPTVSILVDASSSGLEHSSLLLCLFFPATLHISQARLFLSSLSSRGSSVFFFLSLLQLEKKQHQTRWNRWPQDAGPVMMMTVLGSVSTLLFPRAMIGWDDVDDDMMVMINRMLGRPSPESSEEASSFRKVSTFDALTPAISSGFSSLLSSPPTSPSCFRHVCENPHHHLHAFHGFRSPPSSSSTFTPEPF